MPAACNVAVRLIVDRESERLAFTAATYWDLEAKLSGEGREFQATLARVGADRVATGKDFDANGHFVGKQARVITGAAADGLDAGAAHEPAVDGHLG